MSIVNKVKEKIREYESENGPIHDDEYEALFVKFYMAIMASDRSLTTPPKNNHKKNGLR